MTTTLKIQEWDKPQLDITADDVEITMNHDGSIEILGDGFSGFGGYEGCGSHTYYLSLTKDQLIVFRSFIDTVVSRLENNKEK